MTILQTKRCKCPACGATLDVRNSRNEMHKMVRCPVCKQTFPVVFEAKTVYKPTRQPSQEPAGPVQKPDSVAQGNRPGPQQNMPRPVLVHNGVRYPLQAGNNTVGRRGTTSTATVQIDTVDRFMSRVHFLLRVIPLGRDVKVVITNSRSKNGTFLNGQELQPNDEIVLLEGAEIRAGETVMTFRFE